MGNMSNLPVSVCVITKNEEKKIGRMLESLMPYGFEIVIVDTGSSDKTKEIAREYTEKVFDFDWIDDFSAARNYAASCASNNWILMMDADEWVESIDTEEMDYFMKHYRNALGSFWINNVTGTPEHPGGIYRAHVEKFYHRKNYHFVYPIHEQLFPKHSGVASDNLQMNSFFGHDGYCMNEEDRIKKAERNRTLLLKQCEDDPENPYLFYQLGKTCQMTEDHEGAARYFGKALEYDVDPTLDYVNDLMVQYGNELLTLGRYEEALGFEGVKEEFSTTADFVYLMGKIYFENKEYQKAVEEFQNALTIKDCRAQGTNSYLPAYQIAKLCIMAGQKENAVKFLGICGNYPPALDMLKGLS